MKFKAYRGAPYRILDQPEMKAMLAAKAELAKDAAKGFAPVGKTHEYANSITAATDRDEDGHPVGRVTAEAPYSTVIEFGTYDQEAYRVLGKALDALSST